MAVLVVVMAGLVFCGLVLLFSPNATSRLIQAISRQDLVAVERAIEQGADVNHAWEESHKVLMEDAAGGSFIVTVSGMTPLYAAVNEGSAAIVEALLRAGARTDAVTSQGWTPLHLAVQHERAEEMIEMLLRAGAEVNAFSDLNPGWTPLYSTAIFGSPPVARLLLEAGADPDQPDGQGSTPVHHAAQRQDPAMLQVLLEAGGDPDRRADDGDSPLFGACWLGGARTVALLLDHGVEVDARNDRGRTPLIDTAWQNNIDDVIELLLEAGADINARDAEGVTALMQAAGHGALRTLRFLLERGADPDLRDAQGFDAVAHFESNYRSEAARAQVRALFEMFAANPAHE